MQSIIITVSGVHAVCGVSVLNPTVLRKQLARTRIMQNVKDSTMKTKYLGW